MANWFEELTKTLVDEKLTRRQVVLRTLGIVAGAAVAPLISINPVSASMRPRVRRGISTCSGGSCSGPAGNCSIGFANCPGNSNTNCYGFTDINGQGVCGCNIYCSQAQSCSNDSGCPGGYACIASNGCSGCGSSQGVCIPLCCGNNSNCVLGSSEHDGTTAAISKQDGVPQEEKPPEPVEVKLENRNGHWVFNPQIPDFKPGQQVVIKNYSNVDWQLVQPNGQNKLIIPAQQLGKPSKAGPFVPMTFGKDPANYTATSPGIKDVPTFTFVPPDPIGIVILKPMKEDSKGLPIYCPGDTIVSSSNSPAFSIVNITNQSQTVTWTDQGGGSVTIQPGQTQGICLEGPGTYTFSLTGDPQNTFTVYAS